MSICTHTTAITAIGIWVLATTARPALSIMNNNKNNEKGDDFTINKFIFTLWAKSSHTFIQSVVYTFAYIYTNNNNNRRNHTIFQFNVRVMSNFHSYLTISCCCWCCYGIIYVCSLTTITAATTIRRVLNENKIQTERGRNVLQFLFRFNLIEK